MLPGRAKRLRMRAVLPSASRPESTIPINDWNHTWYDSFPRILRSIMCRISKLSLVAFVTFLTGCSTPTPTSEVQQSQQTQLARAPLSKRAKNLFNALLKSAEPNKGKIKTSDENNGTFESGREIDPSYHYKVDVRMEYPPKYPIEKYSTANSN